LPSVLFWRCCLDEAQRIEAPTAASAKMALNLLAVNKWCVTGTPIGRGKLEDLFGLLLFLGLSPLNDKRFFKLCFQSCSRGAIERLQFTLSDIFWRSTKANSSVREQLGIPEQIEHKSLLKFSSVEKHFYQKQLEETILAASQVTQDFEKGKRFKKFKVGEHVLSVNLQRLRAACCHPQVGSGGIGRSGNRGCSGTSLASGVLTMDQILDRLIDDAKTKCEESQRVAVMHSNAIASLNRLKVDARDLGCVDGVDPIHSDLELLKESAKVYTEALELTKTNAVPCEAVGESTLTGTIAALFISQKRLKKKYCITYHAISAFTFSSRLYWLPRCWHHCTKWQSHSTVANKELSVRFCFFP
jgi:E3 ubiquitin-protein ligase SHPRH